MVLGCGPTVKGAWWRKNGAPISSYDGQVWLFEVGVQDEGEYTCSANSQIFNYLLIIQGRTDHVISIEGHVISLAGHVIFLISEMYNDRSTSSFLSLAPPTITTSSTLVYGKEGDTVALDCVAKGRPHPLVHWYHGNAGIYIADPTLTYSPLNNGTLLIYDVSPSVGGAYTCEAENAAGKTQVAMLLIVTTNT